MKLKLLTLIILFLGLYNHVNSQDDLSVPFIVEAEVKIDRKKSKNIDVKIYDDNEVIDVLKTNADGKFSAKLKENKNYTIEITKEDFYPKRISISTKTSRQLNKIEIFAFKVTLCKEQNVPKSEDFFLDFPFALISYNDEKGYFQYDISYTENMQLEEDYIINEASSQK